MIALNQIVFRISSVLNALFSGTDIKLKIQIIPIKTWFPGTAVKNK